MRNRLRLLAVLAALAAAGACDTGRDPVQARPADRPVNAVTDTLPEAGTLDSGCPDTTSRGGVLGSGGGKQGC